jgi:hypothetical protein
MSGAANGDYLSSLSKTIDRSDAEKKTFPPVNPNAAIRTDGLAAMSLSVGIPKEVRGSASERGREARTRRNVCVVRMR